MKSTQEILDFYKPLYKEQETYYHDFFHAENVVKTGIEILTQQGTSDESKLIFTYAMAAHDAGHLVGLQRNDSYNVAIALKFFFEKGNDLSQKQNTICRAIIDSTTTPYLDIKYVLGKYNFLKKPQVKNLIEVARDVDNLGIIGLEEKSQREMALVGLMKEYLVKIPKVILIATAKERTDEFFDKIQFHTAYAKNWASINLETRRQEQLDFSYKAIELAS
jgi:hypothetical protein